MVLSIKFCALCAASNPYTTEGYVVKKGHNTTGDNNPVWHLRYDGVNYETTTCAEHGAVISGVVPTILLASGSRRDPLRVCSVRADTIITPAYAY